MDLVTFRMSVWPTDCFDGSWICVLGRGGPGATSLVRWFDGCHLSALATERLSSDRHAQCEGGGLGAWAPLSALKPLLQQLDQSPFWSRAC